MNKLAEQWGPTIREKQAKYPPKAMDYNRVKDSDGFWDMAVNEAETRYGIKLKIDRNTVIGDIIFFLNMAAAGWEGR